MAASKTGSDRVSDGVDRVARALWYVGPGKTEIRPQPLSRIRRGEARVRMLFSGISRGTERLVFSGNVPNSSNNDLRAPMQEGNFPFPVKYGYCASGIVEDGPSEIVGKRVFVLHPHQDMFIVPAKQMLPVHAGVSAKRATLGANMETALNAHWDAGTGPCQRITVVGAGVVGLLVAYVGARIAGTHVIVVDTDQSRRPIAEMLGAEFRSPSEILDNCDVAFHTSASAQGLETAIACAGLEGTVVEMSWYGDARVNVALGGAFHAKRLRLVSSQVGHVAPAQRPRWTQRRRLHAAIGLLEDDVLDVLVNDEVAFDDAPSALAGILTPGASGLPPVIRYSQPRRSSR